MAKTQHICGLKPYIVIELTEDEAGALDALIGYGIDPFLNTFYTSLGKAYMQPHEAGIRSLFKSLREESGISSFLNKCRDARDVFTGLKTARYISPEWKEKL